MNQDYWQQQTDKPLFPNLLWSRPETKQGAGKLLVIGGQAQEFIHVAESYGAAEAAGVGTVRVFMPDSTRKITKMLPNIEYASSNASGSFAKNAIGELLDASLWSDGVLLSGDLGKNSETSLMLESFITKYDRLLAISSNALSSLTAPAEILFNRENTLLVITRTELQKFGVELKLEKPITSTLGDVELARLLHELTTKYIVNLVIQSDKTIWTSCHGRVASTQLKESKSISSLAAGSVVWTLQHPSKVFEAITAAVFC